MSSDSSTRNGNGNVGPPGGGYGGGFVGSVSKWAPDAFSSADKDWPDWAVKFRSFTASYCRGQVGEVLAVVEAHRTDASTVEDLARSGFDPAPREAAMQLYHALISTCTGLALRLVRKAGDGEGFEAWRLLLNRFDPINKQSVVMSLIRALRWELGS